MSTVPDTIHVLHVDDDPDFADMAATFIEREDDRFAIETATSADKGLDRLRDDEFDCIISDYDMPGMNGIEFLQMVRENHPDLPFILYTGKGSEEVASEAISAGVSDYLQKEGGTDQYTVLANRITNLVSQYRAIATVEEYASHREESEQYRQQLLEIVSDTELSETERVNRLLALGCERLGVENGHLVMIDEEANRHEVISVAGSEIVSTGVTDLSETYCRKTIQSDSVLDVYHAGEQGWEDDPAYEAFGLECYIGGKLASDDRLFGTLCFCNKTPREPFTHNEKAFFDLLRQWFSHMLDRRQRLNQAETVFEHTQDALFLIDVTDEQTFTIQSVNHAYEELTGYTTADLQGQTPRDVLSEDQAAEVEAHFQECIEKREPIEYDEQLTLGDTTKYWHTRLAPVIEDGHVVQLVGATRDITEQRERQRRYDAIFNNTYQFTGLLEPDGTLIEANETALSFGGLDPDDVLGQKMWDTYWFQHSEETRERAREAVERAAEGEFVRHELPVQGTDREAIIDFSVRPLRDEQGAITLLIPEGRDITERKRREQELKEESERFQAIFEKAFDAMVIADDEGTFIDANENATEIFGLPTEELLGRSIEEFASEDFDFEAAWREFQASDQDRGEFPLVRPDGTERIVEYAATANIIPGQHLSVLRDVTDQKDREARLEALNETAQELMAASTQAEVAEIGVTAARDILDLKLNGIHLYDDEQRGLVPVAQTEESKNLVGEAPTFTEGDSIAWRVYESGESLALDDVQDDPDVHNPDTPVRSELYIPIDGYGVLLNASETPEAFDREDIVLGELLAGTIATALEQIERTKQLRTRERDLERQNERLEEFASVVSHDLRNPLRTAEGNLELLKEECDSERIDALGHSLTRMDDLIEDLLTLAREGKTVSDTEAVDLTELVENCWRNVETADATVRLPITRTIQADRSRLAQLLENLIRNAVEHGGDDVTVTVGDLDDGFYVEDDGPGIPKDERDDVFDAGYSTDMDGTGFGLSIVEQVADAHDWTIRVTDGSDGGARFEITGVEFCCE